MARLTDTQRKSIKQEILNQLSPAVPISTLSLAKKVKRSWLLTKKSLEELKTEGKVQVFESKTEKKTMEYWSPA